MDKKIELWSHNKILYINEREEIITIHNKIDELHKHNVKRKKPATKNTHAVTFHLHKAQTQVNEYTHTHSSVIHDSQKVEAIQVSSDRWMDKQNVVYTYNEITQA